MSAYKYECMYALRDVGNNGKRSVPELTSGHVRVWLSCGEEDRLSWLEDEVVEHERAEDTNVAGELAVEA